jgi:hypothetical protein
MDNLVVTPGVPGQVLRKGEVDTGPEEQFQYRKGTGKLLHLQKWARPDILKATRDLYYACEGATSNCDVCCSNTSPWFVVKSE